MNTDNFGHKNIEIINISIMNFNWVLLKSEEIAVFVKKEKPNTKGSWVIEIETEEKTKLHFSLIFFSNDEEEEPNNDLCYFRINKDNKNLLQEILKFTCKSEHIKALLISGFIDLHIDGVIVMDYLRTIRSCFFLQTK